MKLYAFLPPDRYTTGTFHVVEAETVILGPVRARGEADNTAASRAGNPREDPTLPYGDHPAGLYRVTAVIDPGPDQAETYGPAFLALEPLDGQALAAKRAGRTGLGIHGGRLHTDGRLRETYGCLRLDADAIRAVAALVRPRLLDQRIVLYECRLVAGSETA